MGKFIIRRVVKTLVIIFCITAVFFTIFYFTPGDPARCLLAKPVVYLYPETAQEVYVELGCEDELAVTYPEYGDGWHVLAEPDGTITDLSDGKEYSYLFWEAESSDMEADFSKGFCVRGEDTAEFLQETLAAIGLMPREYNEFIVYWMPLMQGNEYNLISFQWENYDAAAPLSVTPEPDSILRVFMAYKAVDEPVDIEPQTFEPFTRDGFTVVEWGGTEVTD